ncbi:MAG TPA: NAD-glutamate dehydrogenase, partial [Magnetovibrio sp.]
VSVVKGSGRGVLKNPKRVVFQELRDLAKMPSDVRAFIAKPDLLMINKTDAKSKVHRPVQMDSIGIKRLDAKGKVIGQRIFVGLFTASAYNKSVRDIPLLRRKIQNTFDAAALPLSSHDGKALLNILETFPRDELFQISQEQLLETSLGILRLQDRQRVALFVRKDDFERFYSCLIYVPRDRYTTDLRRKFQAVLEDGLGGTVTAHYAQLGEQALARLHVVVKTPSGKLRPYDHRVLEERLADLARSWSDRLGGALIEAHGEMEGMRLLDSYQDAFGRGYEDRFSPSETMDDINKIELTYVFGRLGLNLYELNASEGPPLRFKIFQPHHPVALSDVLPMLEHLGLRVLEEIPFRVRPKDRDYKIVMHDFGLEPRGPIPGAQAEIRHRFHEAFDHIWEGTMESDGLNALILLAGLDWREVTVLRAYTKYLRQTGITFSEDYMARTLIENAAIARGIVDLFKVSFALDPKDADQANAKRAAARLVTKLTKMLDDVTSADQDLILRRYINVVSATLRTNFHQRDIEGEPKTWLSFKLSSRDVEGLPLPRPRFEIFVYSPEVEGVHLRFGNVARGGLRWSDRREDFRTEILGLVKAQQVKNAVIVPVGSKGGFVVKRPPAAGASREEVLTSGIACYQTFIRGLLDLTDNLDAKGKVLPPKDVVRLDPDDPYLVVAADKGTATFSDIANAVSEEYGFWLGDAFASGGSQGYDHKKMGITARGGWESVKRHFREMGVDTQTQDFTVAGVGDMSGDVFGNGMLLSPHIKLVAAFNHMHIFLDPTPDAAKTLKERQRLFDLPRSGWNDFDAKLISKGGGVFERRAKWLDLSKEIQTLLGVTQERMSPGEVIKAILKLNVDLLWFGGIGTYIKSTTESHADVGDRSSDAIRVDAKEVRARVIGEGANLGVTQRGRVEYALAGGRLNTDAIDNSAGVDCSDHEVNIKILLDALVQQKKLTPRARNALLVRMTNEVGELVLWDNYEQTQAISLIQARGVEWVDHQMRLMRMLEKSGRLDRKIEYLPDDETLSERAAQGRGLTRPEIAVLMSYSKIWLFDELLDSELPDDSFLTNDLTRYFPTALQHKFSDGIMRHRLRREIIATRVTNSLINRVGGTFVSQIMEKTGMTPSEIARAFIVARETFGVRELWAMIEGLDNKVPAQTQTAMLLDINRLLERGTMWFLHGVAQPLALQETVQRFQGGVAALAKGIGETLPAHYKADMEHRAESYLKAGVPDGLGLAVSGLINLAAAPDIVVLSERYKLDPAIV